MGTTSIGVLDIVPITAISGRCRYTWRSRCLSRRFIGYEHAKVYYVGCCPGQDAIKGPLLSWARRYKRPPFGPLTLRYPKGFASAKTEFRFHPCTAMEDHAF